MRLVWTVRVACTHRFFSWFQNFFRGEGGAGQALPLAQLLLLVTSELQVCLRVCVVSGVCVCLCRVVFLGSGGKVRGKLHPDLNNFFETPNVHCERKMQRV